MDKIKLKLIVDIGLIISFLICGITGILKIYVRGYYALHDYSGIALIILSIIHLALNYKLLISYIKTKIFKNF